MPRLASCSWLKRSAAKKRSLKSPPYWSLRPVTTMLSAGRVHERATARSRVRASSTWIAASIRSSFVSVAIRYSRALTAAAFVSRNCAFRLVDLRGQRSARCLPLGGLRLGALRPSFRRARRRTRAPCSGPRLMVTPFPALRLRAQVDHRAAPRPSPAAWWRAASPALCLPSAGPGPCRPRRGPVSSRTSSLPALNVNREQWSIMTRARRSAVASRSRRAARALPPAAAGRPHVAAASQAQLDLALARTQRLDRAAARRWAGG